MDAILSQILARLGAIERKLGVAAPSGDADERSPLAVDFEAAIVNGPGKALGAAAAALGGEEGPKMAASFAAQFAFTLKVLDMSAKCRKPAPEEVAPLYAELKAAGKALFDLSGPKGSKDADVVNAARGMEQGVSAFGWPLAPSSTTDHVAQGLDSAGLYVQRASKAAKDAGSAKKPLLDLCLAYNAALKAMQEWTKENCKLGIPWNAKGVAPKDFAGAAGGGASASSAAAPAAAAAAPAAAAAAAAPAPVPAAAPAAAAAAAPAPPAGGAAPNLGALFSSIASIDQSSGRTAGLRHVTKEMKSSNSSAAAVVPAAAGGGGGGAAAAPRAAAPAAGGIKMGEAKVKEEGMRWVVEFHTKDTLKAAGTQMLTVGGASLKQEVYIYGCKDVAIDITTRVKAVRLDQCTNVTLLLQGALSGMEVVNSKRMKLQIKERVPSVAIDKTDGCVVGLPWTSRDCVITTSKSSEMNVTFPVSDAADADWVEKPIPEQFVSKITDKNTVVSGVSELYSS